MKRKIVKWLAVTAMALSMGSVGVVSNHPAEAALQTTECSLSITKANDYNHKARATGVCSEYVTGYYQASQNLYIMYGYEVEIVSYSSQQFTLYIPLNNYISQKVTVFTDGTSYNPGILKPIVNNYERFGGKDRFEVQTNLSNKIPSQSLDYVILADGLNYPDALASGVLNNTLNSTTLLISNDTTVINQKVQEAKRLLKPGGKVVIVGGPASVSYTVENTFKQYFPVERIGGKDRIEVSTRIAEKVNPQPTSIFLSYGLVFSDSLSVVPYATRTQTPIILQYGSSLNPMVADYIKAHPTIKNVTIVSGTGVIPTSIESELKSLGVTTVDRVAGKDRFDTSLLIAKKYFPNTSTMALANGFVFADALSGNQFAFKNNMPIILVTKDNAIDATKTFIKSKPPQKIYLYGGPATIADSMKTQF